MLYKMSGSEFRLAVSMAAKKKSISTGIEAPVCMAEYFST